LYDQGDDIGGAEDVQVSSCRNWGDTPSERANEPTENDIDSSSEECRCCLKLDIGVDVQTSVLANDESAYLEQVGSHLIWTGVRPRTASPPKNFTECSNSENKLPPSAISNRYEGVQEHAQAEKNAEHNTSCEGGIIAVCTGTTGNWSNANISVDGDLHDLKLHPEGLIEIKQRGDREERE
jgi:hypothetical protein